MEFNNAFFERLGQSAEVVELVTSVTNEVKEIARETAPVGKTRKYKEGITARVFLHKQKRAVGWVEGTDPKTMLVEATTANLARAIREMARRHRG